MSNKIFYLLSFMGLQLAILGFIFADSTLRVVFNGVFIVIWVGLIIRQAYMNAEPKCKDPHCGCRDEVPA